MLRLAWHLFISKDQSNGLTICLIKNILFVHICIGQIFTTVSKHIPGGLGVRFEVHCIKYTHILTHNLQIRFTFIIQDSNIASCNKIMILMEILRNVTFEDISKIFFFFTFVIFFFFIFYFVTQGQLKYYNIYSSSHGSLPFSKRCTVYKNNKRSNHTYFQQFFFLWVSYQMLFY